MPSKPDERLIILLPPDLLEEVRRAAEEADLSVSQFVRRALRNELKSIAAANDGQGPYTLVEFFNAWNEAHPSKLKGKLSDLVGGLGRIDGTEPTSRSRNKK